MTEAPAAGVGHIAWRCVSPLALDRRAVAVEAADLNHLIDLGAPIQRRRIVDIDFVGCKPFHSVGKTETALL